MNALLQANYTTQELFLPQLDTTSIICRSMKYFRINFPIQKAPNFIVGNLPEVVSLFKSQEIFPCWVTQLESVTILVLQTDLVIYTL